MSTKKRNKARSDDDFMDDDFALDEYDDEIQQLEQLRPVRATHRTGERRERDWRDVEIYHEIRDLRRQLEDIYWLDEDTSHGKYYGRY